MSSGVFPFCFMSISRVFSSTNYILYWLTTYTIFILWYDLERYLILNKSTCLVTERSLGIEHIDLELFHTYLNRKATSKCIMHLFPWQKSLWEAKSARVRKCNLYLIFIVIHISLLYINMVCVLMFWEW